MTFVPAPGNPSYSGNYIPQLFAKKTLQKFYDGTVLAAISNTDYEGMIRGYGDTVHVRTTPDITVRDYVPGLNLQHQHPDSAKVSLVIDKGKYWDFVVDDIDAAQSDIGLVDNWSMDASEQMKIAIDTQVLGNIYADIAAANKGLTAGRKSSGFNIGATGNMVDVDKTNILDYVVHLGSVLDESNVPETGRWLVMPPLFTNLIKRSDIRDASMTGDGTSVLRNGRIGMIDRFTLYQSNNVPSVVDTAKTCYYIMAGHPAALTFASQIVKSETLRSTETFGDIIRGLQVYGFKVMKGDAMALLYADAVLT